MLLFRRFSHIPRNCLRCFKQVAVLTHLVLPPRTLLTGRVCSEQRYTAPQWPSPRLCSLPLSSFCRSSTRHNHVWKRSCFCQLSAFSDKAANAFLPVSCNLRVSYTIQTCLIKIVKLPQVGLHVVRPRARAPPKRATDHISRNGIS